jgi:hypothetical protein
MTNLHSALSESEKAGLCADCLDISPGEVVLNRQKKQVDRALIRDYLLHKRRPIIFKRNNIIKK